MKFDKIFRIVLPCLFLGGLLCSCRQQYYLPGGNYRRKPDKGCGCPSYSQNAPLLRSLPQDEALNENQPVYAYFLSLGDLPHAHEGR